MATKIVCDRCGNESEKPILTEHSGPEVDSKGPRDHYSVDRPARLPLLLRGGAPGRNWKQKDLCPECLDELDRWMDLPKRTKATGRTKK